MIESTSANALARRMRSRIALGVMGLALLICLVPLAAVLVTLFNKGGHALNLHFLTTTARPVGENGGIAHAIVGSLCLLLVASVFAVPLGLLKGMYLARRSHTRLANLTRLLLDAMTGIPAIIIGVFCYTVMVRPSGLSLRIGHSMLVGGLALAMIMLPIFARMTEEAMAAIPRMFDEVGLALGLTRRKVITRIILRSAMPAVLTGLFLALSRVGGEAAPLLFTAFGSNEMSVNPMQPVSSLPQYMFSNYNQPFDEMVKASWGAALVLVLLIMGVRLATVLITHWRYGDGGRT